MGLLVWIFISNKEFKMKSSLPPRLGPSKGYMKLGGINSVGVEVKFDIEDKEKLLNQLTNQEKYDTTLLDFMNEVRQELLYLNDSVSNFVTSDNVNGYTMAIKTVSTLIERIFERYAKGWEK